MTDWYTASGNPTQGSAGSSNVLRSEYNSIATAFSKMPALTGYNGLLVGVNSSGTALQTYSDSEVLSNIGAASSADLAEEVLARTNAIALAIPAGVILMWSGSIASIPTGWKICDGTNGTPDLRNRFVVGAGSSYTVSNTGGSADAIVVSHTHSASSSSSSSFSGNALGSHRHWDNGHTHGYNWKSITGGTTAGGDPNSVGNTVVSTEVGYADISWESAGTPTGSVSTSTTTTINATGVSGTNANLPPYYALAYIQKS